MAETDLIDIVNFNDFIGGTDGPTENFMDWIDDKTEGLNDFMDFIAGGSDEPNDINDPNIPLEPPDNLDYVDFSQLTATTGGNSDKSVDTDKPVDLSTDKSNR